VFFFFLLGTLEQIIGLHLKIGHDTFHKLSKTSYHSTLHKLFEAGVITIQTRCSESTSSSSCLHPLEK